MSRTVGQRQYRPDSTRINRVALIIVLVIVLAVTLGIGAWFTTHHTNGNGPAHAEVLDVALNEAKSTPKSMTECYGSSPDCSNTDCIAMLVNGDLLFHEGLWSHFQDPDPNAMDNTAFNFDPLFTPTKQCIQVSDIAVCEFETPIAQCGGPYAAYPILNTPPEMADATRNVGYNVCTHVTNHSWDQGANGIARPWSALEVNDIAQAGSCKTEANSTKPLIIDPPTSGGKLGLVIGTVSLNGMTADENQQMDHLCEGGDPNHDSGIQCVTDKVDKVRERGADMVAIAMYSVQEYLDYADSRQISKAYESADTGVFDVIYGAGYYCAQPIENYNGAWIIYGLGNAVTESANTSEALVNNRGVTTCIQFVGKKDVKGSWRASRIDWVPAANVYQDNYQWCLIFNDHPIGTCWDEVYDAQIRQHVWDVIYSMDADQDVIKEWNITQEQAAEQQLPGLVSRRGDRRVTLFPSTS